MALTAITITSCNDDQYAIETCEAGKGLSLPEGEAPFLGTRGAPVRLALFGDVRCPHTAEMVLELTAFIDRLEASGKPGLVEVQFRHFPILHSRKLARTAEAAYITGDNDAFWQMYWCLAAAGGDDDDRISACAEWMNMNEEALLEDASSAAVEQAVSRDEAMAEAIGFPGAPGMLLCGFWMPPDPDRIIENIEALLPD